MEEGTSGALDIRVDPEIRKLLQAGDFMIPSDDDSHAVFCREIADAGDGGKLFLRVLAAAALTEDEEGHVYKAVESIPSGVMFSNLSGVPQH